VKDYIIPLLIAGAVVGIIVFLIYTGGKKEQEKVRVRTPTNSPQQTAAKPGFWNSAVTKTQKVLGDGFGIWALILLFLSGAIVYTAPGMLELWWLLPLGLMVVFLILKASTIKSDVARIGGIIAVTAGAFFLVLPNLPGSVPGSPPKLTRSQATELARMHAACPGTKEKQKFLRTYTTIDPQGLCKAVLWTPGRCIYVQNELNHEFGPFCDKPGGNKEVPHIIKAVRSADEEFDGYTELHPNYKRLSFYY